MRDKFIKLTVKSSSGFVVNVFIIFSAHRHFQLFSRKTNMVSHIVLASRISRVVARNNEFNAVTKYVSLFFLFRNIFILFLCLQITNIFFLLYTNMSHSRERIKGADIKQTREKHPQVIFVNRTKRVSLSLSSLCLSQWKINNYYRHESRVEDTYLLANTRHNTHVQRNIYTLYAP